MCSLILANFWSNKREQLGWLLRTCRALFWFQKRLLSRSHEKCQKKCWRTDLSLNMCNSYILPPFVSTNNTQETGDSANLAQFFVSCAPGKRAMRARVPRFCLLEAESSLKIPISFIYFSSITSSYPLRVEDKRGGRKRRDGHFGEGGRASHNTEQNSASEDCFQNSTAGLRASESSLGWNSGAGSLPCVPSASRVRD